MLRSFIRKLSGNPMEYQYLVISPRLIDDFEQMSRSKREGEFIYLPIVRMLCFETEQIWANKSKYLFDVAEAFHWLIRCIYWLIFTYFMIERYKTFIEWIKITLLTVSHYTRRNCFVKSLINLEIVNDVLPFFTIYNLVLDCEGESDTWKG